MKPKIEVITRFTGTIKQIKQVEEYIKKDKKWMDKQQERIEKHILKYLNPTA